MPVERLPWRQWVGCKFTLYPLPPGFTTSSSAFSVNLHRIRGIFCVMFGMDSYKEPCEWCGSHPFVVYLAVVMWWNVWPEVSLSREFSTRYFQAFRLRPHYAKGIWNASNVFRHTTPETECFCDGSVWTVGQNVEFKAALSNFSGAVWTGTSSKRQHPFQPRSQALFPGNEVASLFYRFPQQSEVI